MTKLCPKCHATNRPEARFCLQCNQALPEAGTGALRLCPAGRHPMDPAWSACPYCAGAFGAEKAAPPPPPPPPKPPGERVRKPTEIEHPLVAPQPPAPAVPETNPVPPPSGSRGKTSFHSSEGQTTNVSPPAPVSRLPQAAYPGRRIVAVLITYTWLREGQVFPLYAGRNYIGKDPDCEISLPYDEMLSNHHAAIFFRGEYFEITDERSMNGTFVNDKSVPLTGALALPNYATLRTGATTWRFIVTTPATEAETQHTSRI